MSNLYAKGREKFLGGSSQINWTADNIKAVLVNVSGAGTIYTPNLATHEFLSDIPAGARIATSPNLTGKTNTDGVADADDVVFPAVSGPICEAIAIYKDTGVAGTSPLIALINAAAGLPVTPNGDAIAAGWDNGPNKVFVL